MATLDITSPAKALTQALSKRSRDQRRNRKDACALEAVAAGPRRNDLLPHLNLEQRAVDTLHAPARVLRKIDTAHVAEIARSISAFGVVRPVLITAEGEIVDGVSTVEAARSIGLAMLPCVIIDHLKPDEVRVLRLALNRLGEKAQWDIDELKIEFGELLDIGAPLELTGFSLPEIDVVIMQDDAVLDEAANNTPALIDGAPAISQVGDFWQLGRHRLLCADATKPESYSRLFEGAPLARTVFTDPPYNIEIDGFAVGAGNIKHREFVAASGEMSDAEFDTFLADFLTGASAQLVDGGILYICMDWRHDEHVQRAARTAGLSHINTVVWAKSNGGLGGLYRSAHEFVLVFRKGSAPSLNNIELGKHGRDRTNVWNYPGANQRGSSAHAELANHPTPKPVELVADALLDVTNRKDIVLDAFAGSGTTVIAAQKTGRTAFNLELDPRYVDLIIRRFEKFTGIAAVDIVSGKPFSQMADERRAQPTETARAEEIVAPPLVDERSDAGAVRTAEPVRPPIAGPHIDTASVEQTNV